MLMTDSASTLEFPELITLVGERLARNQRVRRNLPGGGRLRIDRQLPFLCVYRAPPDQQDAGTSDLVTTEAAYLVAREGIAYHESLVKLCYEIGETLHEHFGVFLLLEIWSDSTLDPDVASNLSQPRFRIFMSDSEASPDAMEDFQAGLRAIIVDKQPATVEVYPVESVGPPGLPPLDLEKVAAENGFFHFGVAVRPIYRSRRHNEQEQQNEIYPLVLHALRRQLATALRKSVFAFTNRDSQQPNAHYQSLGPSSLNKSARIVDQQLIDVSESFDFLLQVTPVNSDDAWREFSHGGHRQTPQLHYRPLPYHPSLLKRRLYEVPIEEVEDATLAHLFWEKQTELDQQISGLRNLGTSNFLYNSLHLYGKPDNELIKLARIILDAPIPEDATDSKESVGTEEIVKRAREHFDYYHQQLPEFNARVEISESIASGVMVSQDCLYVSATARFRRERIEPLLHHEVGTHLLTYFNGRQQRLRQLYAGLAGDEALQEGLAVLAEYLAGGLTRTRLRKLAGRVIAVQSMLDGRAFVETFRQLREDYQFTARSAFTTTLRVYRGGGLTKDAIYLRGLRDLLAYLGRGHDIEPLYIGKMSLAHVPIVQQLRRGGIVRPPAILPRLWDHAGISERLEACRGRSVMDLLETDQ